MPISGASADPGTGEFMLFGVRVVVDSMRKSVSLNNLSQYEQPQDQDSNSNDKSDANAVAADYASADDAVLVAATNRGRKRGVPWTEEEHKLFLLGLQKVGKGDWRGIARNFVKTRTPTQVASHAQKYFLRRNNLNRRRRRSSLFDITTEVVSASPMEEEQVQSGETDSQSYSLPPPLRALPDFSNNHGFPSMTTFTLTTGLKILPAQTENPTERLSLGQVSLENTISQKLIHPVAVHLAPNPSTIATLDSNLKIPNDPSALSLRLSLNSDQRESSSRHSAFQAMSSFSNSENIISVA